MVRSVSSCITLAGMDTERAESTVSTVSFRIDAQLEAQLDALATHWKMSRSEVLRRFLEGSPKQSVREAVEDATWPTELVPSASGRYRVWKTHSVMVSMGQGLPRIPHQFTVGQGVERAGHP